MSKTAMEADTKTPENDSTKTQEGGTQTPPGQLEEGHEEKQGHHGHAKPEYKIAAEAE